MITTSWYKVLMNGKSFHGGGLAWSLPSQDSPGEWHEVEGELVICENGLHVTNDPARWFAVGADVYVAECDGFIEQKEDKACFWKVRLIRKLDTEELRQLRIAGDGELVVRENDFAFVFGSCQATAHDSSQVTAYNSSQVKAYDSSRVKAYDSSRVEAYNASQVKAYNASQVKAYNSSRVEAWDSSRVTAWDSSHVIAWGSSQVIARNSSQVRAYDSSQVEAHGSSRVETYDLSRIVV